MSWEKWNWLVPGTAVEAMTFEAESFDWEMRVRTPEHDLSAEKGLVRTFGFRMMNEISMGRCMLASHRAETRNSIVGQKVQVVEFVIDGAMAGPYIALTFDCGEISIRVSEGSEVSEEA